jgi:hypothetical protein
MRLKNIWDKQVNKQTNKENKRYDGRQRQKEKEEINKERIIMQEIT